MLKRRRKLSKDLQIRKKITTFAEEKLHLGIIAQASLASSALDLHFLCIVLRRTEARTVIRIHEWDKIFCGGQ